MLRVRIQIIKKKQNQQKMSIVIDVMKKNMRTSDKESHHIKSSLNVLDRFCDFK